MNGLTEIEATRYSRAAIAVIRALNGYLGLSCVYANPAWPAVMVYNEDELVSGAASGDARALYKMVRSEMRLERGRNES